MRELSPPDWQRICLDIRTHYAPLSRVAKEVGSDERHLNRLARGEVQQPRFMTGVKLLDLHFDCMKDCRK